MDVKGDIDDVGDVRTALLSSRNGPFFKGTFNGGERNDDRGHENTDIKPKAHYLL